MRLRPAPLAAALTLAVGLSACATVTSSPDGADGPTAEIAATVNGIDITSARVEELAAAQEGFIADLEGEELDDARAEIARNVLTAEIQVVAVEAAVEERFGLDIPDDEVDAQLEESIEEQGGQAAFEEMAAEQGLTSEEAMAFARQGAYVTALVEYLRDQLVEEAGIDDAELQTRYDADPTAFQSSIASHILVETEAEAQDVLDRLEAGETFEDLAMELSQDPGSGANGGALGEAPRGSYVPEFQEAIYAEDTVIGEVVGPVETQFGFHLIRVDEIVVQSFEDVRDSLEEAAVNELFTEFLEGVFADLDVTVDPFFGEWDPVSRTITPPADPAEGETGADAGSDGEDDTTTDEG